MICAIAIIWKKKNCFHPYWVAYSDFLTGGGVGRGVWLMLLVKIIIYKVRFEWFIKIFNHQDCKIVLNSIIGEHGALWSPRVIRISPNTATHTPIVNDANRLSLFVHVCIAWTWTVLLSAQVHFERNDTRNTFFPVFDTYIYILYTI